MDFDYGEVDSQEILDELKKVKGVICINDILDDVPDNVIVLSKIDSEDEIIGVMDINDLTISDDKRIIIIVPKITDK